MEFKNIEILSREVSILGNFLKANKSNPDWIKIVDYKKNTTKADNKIDALLKFILQKNVKDVPVTMNMNYGRNNSSLKIF